VDKSVEKLCKMRCERRILAIFYKMIKIYPQINQIKINNLYKYSGEWLFFDQFLRQILLLCA